MSAPTTNHTSSEKEKLQPTSEQIMLAQLIDGDGGTAGSDQAQRECRAKNKIKRYKCFLLLQYLRKSHAPFINNLIFIRDLKGKKHSHKEKKLGLPEYMGPIFIGAEWRDYHRLAHL